MDKIDTQVMAAIAKVVPAERSRWIYFGWVIGGLRSTNSHFISKVSHCRFNEARNRFTCRVVVEFPDSGQTVPARYVWKFKGGRFRGSIQIQTTATINRLTGVSQ